MNDFEFDLIPDDIMDEMVSTVMGNNSVKIIDGHPYVNWNVLEGLLNTCIDVDEQLGGDGTRGVAMALLAMRNISLAVVAKQGADSVESALRLIDTPGDSDAPEEEKREA
jgi:hypothetical protein